MPRKTTKTNEPVATIGIDLGKNTFHLIGLSKEGAIVMQAKLSRSQLGRRLCNMPRCLIGMEACSGAHFIGRMLEEAGHDVRLIPAQYVKPFLKGHKNDYRDAECQGSGQPSPVPSLLPSEMRQVLPAGGTSVPGWDWCHDRCPPGIERSSGVSPSAATVTSERCWYRLPTSSWYGGHKQRSKDYGPGSRRHPSGCIATCW